MSYLISLRLIDRSADRITGAPPPCAPPPQPRGQLVRSGAWRNTDADRHERPGALPAGSDECIEQEWARLERCCGLYTQWDFMPKSARIWQWTITYLETVGVCEERKQTEWHWVELSVVGCVSNEHFWSIKKQHELIQNAQNPVPFSFISFFFYFYFLTLINIWVWNHLA